MGCSLACRLAQDAAGAVGASTPSDSKNASSDSDSKGASTHTSTTSRRPFVELIEARPPVPLAEAMAKGKPDPRVYSLTPSSVSVLEGLQVWSGKKGTEADDETLKERSQPFGDMQVRTRLDHRSHGRIYISTVDHPMALELGRRGVTKKSGWTYQIWMQNHLRSILSRVEFCLCRQHMLP